MTMTTTDYRLQILEVEVEVCVMYISIHSRSTANSAQRVGRALDEINDDGCFITQPATTPIGTPGHQNDLAERFLKMLLIP